MSNMVAWVEGTVSPDPRHLPSRDEEAANYREMADILAEAGADLLLLEVMSDIDHANLCLEAALATGLPVWVGVSCSRLPDGSMIGWDIAHEEHARLADDHKAKTRLPLAEVIAGLMTRGGDVYGFMHSSIEATGPGLDILNEFWDGPVMAYPETLIFDSTVAVGARSNARPYRDPFLVLVVLPMYSIWKANASNNVALKGLALLQGSVRSILALTVVGSFVIFFFGGASLPNGTRFTEIVAALTEIAGTVIGFYFGSGGSAASGK